MNQDGREAKLAPGGFVFSDSSRPYAIDFIDNFAPGVLRIPRRMLLQRIGAPRSFTPLRVHRTSGLGAMVASMLRDLPALLPAIPKIVDERVADNIVDLAAAALLSTGEGMPLSARLTLTDITREMDVAAPESNSVNIFARSSKARLRDGDVL